MRPLSKNVFLGVLIMLILIAFGGSLSNEYSMDDIYVIQENPYTTQGISGIPDILTSRYTLLDGVETDYRPIVLVSYAIEYDLFGHNPTLSHLINLVLYVLVGIVLYNFLKRLFKDEDKLLVQLITLLFMLHPLHSEVVLSLKNRDELFVALFGFLSLSQWLKYADNKWIGNLVYALSLFFLSVISKKTGVGFVPIIVVALLYKTKSLKKASPALLVVLPLFFYKLFHALVVPSQRNRITHFHENPLYTMDWGFLQKVPVAANTITRYMELFFWPDPLRYYYGYDIVDIPSWSHSYAIGLLVLHLLLFGIAVYALKTKFRIAGLGLIIWYATVILYSNLFNPAVGILAERFVFVPILGLCMSIGFLLFYLIRSAKLKQVGLGLSAITLLLMLGKNIDRTPDWETEDTLYEADMPHLQKSFKAHYTYAISIYNRLKATGNRDTGAWGQVLAHIDTALAIIPGEPIPLNTQGVILMNYFGDFKLAKSKFYQAVQGDSLFLEAWVDLGQAYQYLGMNDSATYAFEKALVIDPAYELNLKLLCTFYSQIENGEELIRVANVAIEQYPDSYFFNTYLANGYALEGDYQNALYYFKKAYYIKPSPKICQGILKLATGEGYQEYVEEFSPLCN